MPTLVKELVEAGIHFGHRSTNWNPKMKPYIFGKRNKIHIIDLKATVKGLLLARKYITGLVASGQDVLFVGTKRQARNTIETRVKDTGMHWVCERWLGGTLTNFRTIRERLKRLEELEGLDESGEINNYSKKMESNLRREKNKILRNLSGIRNMTKLPGAMIVIDVSHEINAVKEARKLGIPTVCLIDTDSDPAYADIPIPGNDDAMRSIEVIIQSLCAAVMEGKSVRREAAEGEDQETGETGDAAEQSLRRGSRAMFRANEETSNPATDSGAEPQAEAQQSADADHSSQTAESASPTTSTEGPKGSLPGITTPPSTDPQQGQG